MEYEKTLWIGLVVFVVFLFASYNMPTTDDEEYQELTTEQIKAHLELGTIKLYKDLKHNSNDFNTEVILKTGYGSCYVYRDIFGRYYCRW